MARVRYMKFAFIVAGLVFLQSYWILDNVLTKLVAFATGFCVIQYFKLSVILMSKMSLHCLVT